MLKMKVKFIFNMIAKAAALLNSHIKNDSGELGKSRRTFLTILHNATELHLADNNHYSKSADEPCQ